MAAPAARPALLKPPSSVHLMPPSSATPPAPSTQPQTGNTTLTTTLPQPQTKKKKKKKTDPTANRPPPVKTNNGRTVGAGSKSKKSSHGADLFPIPLTFLYRDPRPNMGRRNAGAAAAGGGGGGGLEYGGGGTSGDQWGETDGDGLPIKETAEQVREKKTLYSANMAQAQAFANNYRFQDAQTALTKVRVPT